ncbi:DUF2586 family protein [Photobacterium phosphoreum]|uniref:DUF2586 family protein n=1 Tax=Photobacterium phosphoreum TaxID=659 RepID=A0AAW4ZYX9_PHOPO|nr:DUF2586 domain-containing protein [Photobacterium phosphoreum]MCD9491348.1 DUF2586 family protein [Photobacterium phosphoreum]MCD9502387.1 DUF2586 family protein [Photobacterium phosphoreum]MCF2190614.1 DUF2586 family protein [Photobacterium phosphoreum]MCF2302199.1 DUF2586 family protein [Photobacterium phosphoreum]
MLGTVSVSSKNGYQNTVNEIERRFVFIGKTAEAALQNTVTHLNARSDIDALFKGKGKATDTLYNTLVAAQLNGKTNWSASFVGLTSDGNWASALMLANTLLSYEAVVLIDPMANKAAIEAVSAEMASIESKQARYMFAMTCIAPVTTKQSWSEYESAAVGIITGINAPRIMCVPTLFGNDIGVLAGRLCDRSVTIADSPMRVKTGALLGLGPSALDKNSQPFPETLLAVLDTNRFSVPQTYPGEQGWYWADGNTLDIETGDFKVIEYLRIVLKACRNVYKIALPTIADRALNSSPQSIARNKALYMKPLLQMATPVKINNASFPGEIEPPKESAVEINWVTDKKTEIYISIRPIGCQKDINIGVGIDLSKAEQGEN